MPGRKLAFLQETPQHTMRKCSHYKATGMTDNLQPLIHARFGAREAPGIPPCPCVPVLQSGKVEKTWPKGLAKGERRRGKGTAGTENCSAVLSNTNDIGTWSPTGWVQVGVPLPGGVVSSSCCYSFILGSLALGLTAQHLPEMSHSEPALPSSPVLL